MYFSLIIINHVKMTTYICFDPSEYYTKLPNHLQNFKDKNRKTKEYEYPMHAELVEEILVREEPLRVWAHPGCGRTSPDSSRALSMQ